MSEVYSAQSIANFFLGKSEVSPMKLQKLIYYAHGWFLALYDRPLINEFVEAWEYGPVIPSLYHDFKHYGNSPISEKALLFEGEPLPENNPRVVKFLNRIWELYSGFTGMQLSNMTHAAGTPWEMTVAESQEENYGLKMKNEKIPNKLISDYFKQQAQKT
jgi:uncharacterized phage-associated protein